MATIVIATERSSASWASSTMAIWCLNYITCFSSGPREFILIGLTTKNMLKCIIRYKWVTLLRVTLMYRMPYHYHPTDSGRIRANSLLINIPCCTKWLTIYVFKEEYYSFICFGCRNDWCLFAPVSFVTAISQYSTDNDASSIHLQPCRKC